MDTSFAALLRAHRRANGLTQEALAELARLSGQAVGALERGDRRFPYGDTVARLADALGLSEQERRAFQAAAARPSVPRPETPSPSAPRQLPAVIAHFAGRAAPAKAMAEVAGHSSTVVISAISGMAGIGKTAFALHCAHQLKELYPDGQLYANLHGFDPSRPPVSPASVVHAFLEALDIPARRIPGSAEAQAGLYRSVLAGKQILIVLDNARDAEQVRPLLPGDTGCLTLITSRNQLTSLATTDGAQLLTLDLLSEHEALDLLAARLSAERVAADLESAREIVVRCGRLPLALSIVAARAAAHPHFTLADLATELSEAEGLDALDGNDPTASARTTFAVSYQALSAPAARLFRLLGAHPGPDISIKAAASLTGGSVREQRLPLKELTEANLILEHQPGRFGMHDLIRAYACELDAEPDARRRMLDHYLHSAFAANCLLIPAGERITLNQLQPGTTPEQPEDHDDALAWFTAERAVLLAVIDYAAAAECNDHAWQLAWIFTDFLNRRGDWQADISTQRAALTAARRLGHVGAQARALRLLALDFTQLGSLEEALSYLQQALELTAEADDARGQAHTHNHLAFVYERLGLLDKTLHHAQQALRLFEISGSVPGRADGLNAVGWSLAQLGQYDEALRHCQEALALQTKLANRAGQAAAWDSLGYIHHHLGQHALAISCYTQAVELHRDVGNRYYEANVLSHLGDTQLAAAQRAQAAVSWKQALSILTELEHADAAQVRAKLGDL